LLHFGVIGSDAAFEPRDRGRLDGDLGRGKHGRRHLTLDVIELGARASKVSLVSHQLPDAFPYE
jgi:hypothetical protein